MKKILCALSTCLLMAGAAQAAVVQWDGGGTDTEWNTVENWANDTALGATAVDRGIIGNGDIATVTSAVATTNSIDLDMQGGSLTIAADLATVRRIYVRSGTVAQTAGSVTVTDGAQFGYIDNGTYAISGGSYAMNGDFSINNTGTFSVSNSSASVTIGNGAGDNMTIVDAGTLNFTMDGSGVSAISVFDTFTVNGASSLLTIDGSAYTGGNTDITLVNASTMTGTFAAGKYTVTGMGEEGTDWTLTQGTNGDVVLNVIPEPATLGLVAAFGGGLLFVRRRFMM